MRWCCFNPFLVVWPCMPSLSLPWPLFLSLGPCIGLTDPCRPLHFACRILCLLVDLFVALTNACRPLHMWTDYCVVLLDSCGVTGCRVIWPLEARHPVSSDLWRLIVHFRPICLPMCLQRLPSEAGGCANYKRTSNWALELFFLLQLKSEGCWVLSSQVWRLEIKATEAVRYPVVVQ